MKIAIKMNGDIEIEFLSLSSVGAFDDDVD